MKKPAALILLLALALLLSSCAAAGGSQIGIDSIRQRLEQVDAFKQTIPDRQEPSVIGALGLSFRGVPYGSIMSQVEAFEEQPVVHTYYNALDFDSVSVYSYSMTITYWFDDAGQFYSASYSMEHSDYAPVAADLQAQLKAEFGEPLEAGYYDFNSSVPVTFAGDDEASAALSEQSAYYYVSYISEDGLIVELFAQGAETGGYAYYIYYTDPAYMESELS